MFVGHYGPALVAKARRRDLPLWVLFLAAEAVDVVWAALVLAGIEALRIVPGITAASPLDLFYMPFTHSLPAALAWAAAAVLVARRAGAGRPTATVLGVVVLSHWLLDLVVHRPDLPLLGDRYKVGLGLWDHPAAALTLELGLVLGGLALWQRAAAAAGAPLGRRPLVLGAVLGMAQASLQLGPPPPSARGAATAALCAYLALARLARWAEGPEPAPSGD